jgi:hypothetical protein
MPKPPRTSTVNEKRQESSPDEHREPDLDKGRRPEPEPQGAMRMLGFARRFRQTRSTADWMAELRGEAKS